MIPKTKALFIYSFKQNISWHKWADFWKTPPKSKPTKIWERSGKAANYDYYCYSGNISIKIKWQRNLSMSSFYKPYTYTTRPHVAPRRDHTEHTTKKSVLKHIEFGSSQWNYFLVTAAFNGERVWRSRRCFACNIPNPNPWAAKGWSLSWRISSSSFLGGLSQI